MKRLNRDALTVIAGNAEGKMIDASPAARKRGAELIRFMGTRSGFTSLTDFLTYFELRVVKRYRITVLPTGVLIFGLPPAKLSIMREARTHRVAGSTWVVTPLRWWQRGRVVHDMLTTCEVV